MNIQQLFPGMFGGQQSYTPPQLQQQPRPVFTPAQTATARSQAMARASQAADLSNLMKQFDRPGVSRSAANVAAALPQRAEMLAQGAAEASQIGWGDQLANARSMMQGQGQLGANQLAMANLLGQRGDLTNRQALGNAGALGRFGLQNAANDLSAQQNLNAANLNFAGALAQGDDVTARYGQQQNADIANFLLGNQRDRFATGQQLQQQGFQRAQQAQNNAQAGQAFGQSGAIDLLNFLQGYGRDRLNTQGQQMDQQFGLATRGAQANEAADRFNLGQQLGQGTFDLARQGNIQDLLRTIMQSNLSQYGLETRAGDVQNQVQNQQANMGLSAVQMLLSLLGGR